MAEDSCPQVFVVDGPINNAPPPIRQKSFWRKARKNLLLLLFGLVVMGLLVEGIFIYSLYQRTEAFLSHIQQVNQSNLQSPVSDGHKMGQVGDIESNEVELQPKKIRVRPMAHLQGSETVGENDVVQWVKNNAGFTSDMNCNSSGLVINIKGYYYLYSKVHFQETEDCVLVNHRVVRNTTEYGLPIELMKSKSLYCRNEHPNQKNVKKVHSDLWNSFLAGVFKLEAGDHIFVTLDKGLYPGPDDNFFGAFMMR